MDLTDVKTWSWLDWFSAEQWYALTVALLLGAVVVAFMIALARVSYTPRDGTLKMGKRNKNELQERLVRLFENFVEGEILARRLNRAQGRAIYIKASKAFDLAELAYPDHPNKMKAIIRNRMGNGAHKPVKIPGDPPPQEVPPQAVVPAVINSAKAFKERYNNRKVA